MQNKKTGYSGSYNGIFYVIGSALIWFKSVNAFVPSSQIIKDDITIKKVLDFVEKVNTVYNNSKFGCGCFYVDWQTDTDVKSIIGREEMLNFLQLIHSNETFGQVVRIYSEITKLKNLKIHYHSMGIGHCCNYNAQIQRLKDQLSNL